MFRPLSERNVRMWAVADVVSVGGNWVQILGLNWLVLSLTGSATAMGFSLMLQAVPGLIFSGWGGALADRLAPRPVLLWCQAVRIGLALALAGTAALDFGGLTVIYVVIVAGGIVGTLEGPALSRYGVALVPPRLVGAALGLGSVLGSGARILGMAVGAVLMDLVGAVPLFLTTAVAFASVMVALAAIRRGEAPAEPAAPADAADSGVRAGLRYLLRQPVILIVLALSFVLGSLGRNYQLTMAAMSNGPLEAGGGGYGTLSTVFALGGVAGGLLAAAHGRTGLRLLLCTGAGISALQLLSGFSPTLTAFAVVVGPIAAGSVVVDTVVATRVQLDAHPRMRGRMVAALGLVSSLAGIVGAPVLGWLCDDAGPRAALVVGGVITTAACVTAGGMLLRVRGMAARTALSEVADTVRRAAPALARA